MAEQASPPPVRLVSRDGRPTLRRAGAHKRVLRDLYFSLLRMPWTRLDSRSCF